MSGLLAAGVPLPHATFVIAGVFAVVVATQWRHVLVAAPHSPVAAIRRTGFRAPPAIAIWRRCRSPRGSSLFRHTLSLL